MGTYPGGVGVVFSNDPGQLGVRSVRVLRKQPFSHIGLKVLFNRGDFRSKFQVYIKSVLILKESIQIKKEAYNRAFNSLRAYKIYNCRQ